jgi:response regulator NasT
LVVDDDRVVLASLEAGLHSAGYDVSVAASAKEAVDQIAISQPDLIVLDLRMPGMDGLQFAEHLSNSNPVPMLVLSAYSDRALVQGAVKRGVMGYVLKPIDVPELVPSIEAALARGRELIQLRDSENRLATALVIEQNTRVAVGVLMERQGLDQRAAFEKLRRHARSQRRKIVDVAKDILSASELLNLLQRTSKSKRSLHSDPEGDKPEDDGSLTR